MRASKGKQLFQKFQKISNSKINKKIINLRLKIFKKIPIFQKFKNSKNQKKKNLNFHKKSKFQNNFNISKFQKISKISNLLNILLMAGLCPMSLVVL